MRVLVAAASPVNRAGLKALVEDSGAASIIGCTDTGELVERARELNPDAILWQLPPHQDVAAILRSLENFHVVVLGLEPARDLIRAGASGVLPADASSEQIAIALEALGAGLCVSPLDRPDITHDATVPSILTARETEILRMIAEGLANKEIAWRLGISDHTVKFHVSALLGKLGVSSRAEAISAGIRHGVIML
jgi:DNA-binding NarL/FixJ family response regulator